MKTFKQHLNEKTEYYLDTSQDNTEKYVAYDGSYWYTGKIGIRGGEQYLKFHYITTFRSPHQASTDRIIIAVQTPNIFRFFIVL